MTDLSNEIGSLSPIVVEEQLHQLYDHVTLLWVRRRLSTQAHNIDELTTFRNKILFVAHLIRKRAWLQADYTIITLPACFRQIMYNRCGKLLDLTLGETYQRPLNLAGEPDLFAADDVLYFG